MPIDIIKNKSGQDVFLDPGSGKWKLYRPEETTVNSRGQRVYQSAGKWYSLNIPEQKTQPTEPSFGQQLFTGAGAEQGKVPAMIGQALGQTAGKVVENISDLPKTMGRQATELAKATEKTARFLVPAYGAATLIPGVKKAVEGVFTAPEQQYSLNDEEIARLSKENVGEKTLRAAVELAPQLILFHQVSGGGRAVVNELKPVVEGIAKRYGYQTVQEALPVISRVFGSKTPQTIITAAGNAIGFGGYEGTKAAATGKPVGEVIQSTASGASMGLMPLATAAAPTALKPVAAAAAGAGLAALGGADVKDVASSGLLWGAMELMGLPSEKDPAKAKTKIKEEAVKVKTTDPSRAEDLESLITLQENAPRMTDVELQSAVDAFVTPQGKRAAQLAIKNYRAATTDKLTGVKNRAAFDAAYSDALAKGDNLLVLDIDKFKNFNDTYGHKAGDVVLAGVAKKIQDLGARVFRYGGEEFTILVPTGTDPVKFGETVRATIGGSKTAGYDVTASIGAGKNFEIADKALYQAKELGRNRVEAGELAQPKISPEFTSLIGEMQIGVDRQQAIYDALRTETVENARDILARQGIPVPMNQLMALDAMIKGGAGMKRESGLAVASSLEDVNRRLEQGIIQMRGITKENDPVLTSAADTAKKLGLWQQSNERQYDESVSQVLRNADLRNIEKYIGKQEQLTGGGLRLANDKLTELADRYHGKLGEVKGEDVKLLLGHADIINEIGRFADAAKNALDLYFSSSDPVERAEAFKASKVLFEKVRELGLKDRELTTAEARLLQYRKKKKDVSGVSSYVKKVMSDTDITRMTDDEFLANIERLRAATPGEIVELAKPTIADMLTAGYYASLLSGPSTHAKNIISTGINTAVEQALTAITQPTNFPKQAAAIGRGVKTGAKEFVETFKRPGASAGKFDIATPTATNKIMKVFDFVGKALSAEDAFFRAINYESSLSSMAYDLARAQGGDVGKTHREFMANPTDEMIKQARYEAARNTFNQNPEGLAGEISKQISRITEYAPLAKINPKWNFKPGKLVVPFTRVVANVLNAGIDWTPMGLLRAAEYKKGAVPGIGDFKQRDYSRQMARALLGTTALGFVYALNDKYDVVTGSGPKSKTQRETLRLAGWRPNSVKIGDTYIPYYNLGPVGLGLAVIGNFNDAVKYGKMNEKDAVDKVIYTMIGTGKTLLDQSFLTGISSVISALRDNDEQSIYRILANPVTAVNPNLVRQINDFFDDKKYDRPEKFTQYIMNELRPVTKPFYKPEPRVNILGEMEQKEGGKIGRTLGIPIIKPREEDYTPVLKYIAASGGKLSGTKAEFSDPYTGEIIKLDGMLKTEFEKARGQNYRANLLQVESDITSAETLGELQTILNQEGEAATQDAVDYILDTYPEEVNKFRKVSKKESPIGVQ